jgi:hypothetical protein
VQLRRYAFEAFGARALKRRPSSSSPTRITKISLPSIPSGPRSSTITPLQLKAGSSASYCLREWAEPVDEQADIDDGSDPGEERLSDTERIRRRSYRAGRRNTTLWRGCESC